MYLRTYIIRRYAYVFASMRAQACIRTYVGATVQLSGTRFAALHVFIMKLTMTHAHINQNMAIIRALYLPLLLPISTVHNLWSDVARYINSYKPTGLSIMHACINISKPVQLPQFFRRWCKIPRRIHLQVI